MARKPQPVAHVTDLDHDKISWDQTYQRSRPHDYRKNHGKRRRGAPRIIRFETTPCSLSIAHPAPRQTTRCYHKTIHYLTNMVAFATTMFVITWFPHGVMMIPVVDAGPSSSTSTSSVSALSSSTPSTASPAVTDSSSCSSALAATPRTVTPTATQTPSPATPSSSASTSSDPSANGTSIGVSVRNTRTTEKNKTKKTTKQHAVESNDQGSIAPTESVTLERGTTDSSPDMSHEDRPNDIKSFSASASKNSPTTSNQRPKPTTSKRKATSSLKLHGSSSSSSTVRRIQQEWEDLVEAGMGYDWIHQRPILPQRQRKREQQEQHHDENEQDSVHPQHVWIGPLHRGNLHTWHFSILGVSGSPYENGVYHGRLRLPLDYPYSPPRLQVWTPSGRFQVKTDVCLSASHYHPETWTATWTMRTLTQALRLHMLTAGNEIGGISTCSTKQRRKWAQQSHMYRTCIGLRNSKRNQKKIQQQHPNQQAAQEKEPIWVDHAVMIRQGLFPLEEEATTGTEDEETASLPQRLDTPSLLLVNDEDDIDSTLRSISETIPPSNRARSVSGVLQRILSKHFRLALWALVVLFLFLNRPFS